MALVLGNVVALIEVCWPFEKAETRQRRSRLSPLIVIVLLCLWSTVVCPFSEYGDNWAILPAVLALPIVVLAHLRLLVVEREKFIYLQFAAIHLPVFFWLWGMALMAISKDCV